MGTAYIICSFKFKLDLKSLTSKRIPSLHYNSRTVIGVISYDICLLTFFFKINNVFRFVYKDKSISCSFPSTSLKRKEKCLITRILRTLWSYLKNHSLSSIQSKLVQNLLNMKNLIKILQRLLKGYGHQSHFMSSFTWWVYLAFYESQ